MSDEHIANPKSAKETLEIERLALENQKLRAELDRLQPTVWDVIHRFSPLLGGLLAVAGFLFGVIRYVDQQDQMLATHKAELEREAAARDQEFMKPLWERELATYFLISDTVATIATTPDAAKRASAEERFWRLSDGTMVIFETKALSAAMEAFGNCLNGTDHCSSEELRNRGLAVSSALQGVIDEHGNLRLSRFSKGKYQYHR